MDSVKLLDERFIGGQILIQGPEDRYRGEIKTIKVNCWGDLHIGFLWLAKDINYPLAPKRWVRVSSRFLDISFTVEEITSKFVVNMGPMENEGGGDVVSLSLISLSVEYVHLFPPGSNRLNPQQVEGF